jgi:hypothetical protein
MSISNNTLAAYFAGKSTIEEEKAVFKEIAENKAFSELLEVLDEVDSIDGLDELQNEFYESIDDNNKFIDYSINIK